MGSRRIASTLAAIGMLGLLPALPACSSYTNVPGREAPPVTQDPNAKQAIAVTTKALQWAVRRHPVDGPFLINLPVGTIPATAQQIADALGPNAVIPTEGGPSLPTYHVARVWVRLTDAKVDIVYPVRNGRTTTQRAVTVWLGGAFAPTAVSRGQYWTPGAIDAPSIWVPVDPPVEEPAPKPAPRQDPEVDNQETSAPNTADTPAEEN